MRFDIKGRSSSESQQRIHTSSFLELLYALRHQSNTVLYRTFSGIAWGQLTFTTYFSLNISLWRSGKKWILLSCSYDKIEICHSYLYIRIKTVVQRMWFMSFSKMLWHIDHVESMHCSPVPALWMFVYGSRLGADDFVCRQPAQLLRRFAVVRLSFAG